MNAESCLINTPVGPLRIHAEWPGVLKQIDFVDGEVDGAVDTVNQTPEACREAVRQLFEYFRGERHTFDMETEPEGTEFQRKVWLELKQIPYGEVITYGEQARRLGNLKASRAVGTANGANPIPIVIPCHRVVGADGSLTGFGGGLWRKRKLLEHEGGRFIREKLVDRFI